MLIYIVQNFLINRFNVKQPREHKSIIKLTFNFRTRTGGLKTVTGSEKRSGRSGTGAASTDRAATGTGSPPSIATAPRASTGATGSAATATGREAGGSPAGGGAPGPRRTTTTSIRGGCPARSRPLPGGRSPRRRFGQPASRSASRRIWSGTPERSSPTT